MTKIKRKSKDNNGITATSPIPKEILKWSECWLIHEKIPILVGTEIKYYCIICTEKRLKKNL
jgi:hypothetical protein